MLLLEEWVIMYFLRKAGELLYNNYEYLRVYTVALQLSISVENLLNAT